MAKKTTEYAVRKGTFLHDPITRNVRNILNEANLTEELALFHIAFNPVAIKYFTRTPADLQLRLNKFLESKGERVNAANAVVNNRVETISAQLKAWKDKIAGLKAEIVESEKILADLQVELSNSLNVLSASVDTEATEEEPEEVDTDNISDEVLPEEESVYNDILMYLASDVPQKDILSSFDKDSGVTKKRIKELIRIAKNALLTVEE